MELRSTFLRIGGLGVHLLRLWLNVAQSDSFKEDCSVQSFITSAKKWDEPRLIEAVGQDATEAICRVQNSFMVGRLRFLGDDLTTFSVCKAYKLIMRSSGVNNAGNQKWNWRLPCSQRIKGWCWKAFKGSVPMKSFLFSWGQCIICVVNIVIKEQKIFIISLYNVLGLRRCAKL